MSRNLLVGNGLIIQYGGNTYSSRNIIERTIENAKNGRYEEGMKRTLPPDEAFRFFELLKGEISNAINEKYDQFALSSTEESALADFKHRYPKGSDVSWVGFEDYFLVMRLIYNRFKESNETRVGVSTALRRLFLDAIFNNGEINRLYDRFSKELPAFFQSFSNIFTTNYDLNIENCSGMKVCHLHGQFDVLEPVYDMNSIRNMISDQPANNFDIPEEYIHVYCNALMDFSKGYQFNMHNDANSGLDKSAIAYTENEEFKKQVDAWENDTNHVLRNLYEGIKKKVENPKIEFQDYFVSSFKGIIGNMEILGLSPNNDTHILKLVKDNDNVKDIKYYYYDISEGEIIKEFFDNKAVPLLDVRGFWDVIGKDSSI